MYNLTFTDEILKHFSKSFFPPLWSQCHESPFSNVSQIGLLWKIYTLRIPTPNFFYILPNFHVKPTRILGSPPKDYRSLSLQVWWMFPANTSHSRRKWSCRLRVEPTDVLRRTNPFLTWYLIEQCPDWLPVKSSTFNKI